MFSKVFLILGAAAKKNATFSLLEYGNLDEKNLWKSGRDKSMELEILKYVLNRAFVIKHN